MASQRDPITCHVLDTVKGKPATGISVTLAHVAASGIKSAGIAQTDGDGRITAWGKGADTDISSVLAKVEQGTERPELTWLLTFHVEDYFGGEGFWSDIDIRFKTKHDGQRSHWHVPLLLSPWSYTTYRGS